MNLPAFEQSVFLQSLGWAIANSIWQCGLLWMLYQVIASSYDNASSRFRSNLSTALLFGNFLWFVGTFVTRLIYLGAYLPGSTANPLLYYQSYIVPGNLNLRNAVSSVVFTLPYLSLAYIVLLIIFAIRLVNSYRNTRFIKNNGLYKPDAEWRVFVERVANHIGLNRKIKIWFSKYVDVPATIGFLKPVILIPLASLNQLTPDQIEAIILHEISHIKRDDYLINLFISLIETILFFNPFVVLLSRIIKEERENCCDDFVLQYQYDRHSYASALLVLEKSREQQFQLALTATSGSKQLLFRIRRIMEAKNSHDGLNYGQKLLALLVSTGIICSIAWLTPEKKARAHPEKHVQGKSLIHAKPAHPAIKMTDSSLNLKYKEPKKITSLFVKPPVLSEVPANPDVPESFGASGSNEIDQSTDEGNDDESSIEEVYNKAFQLKNPVLLSQLDKIRENLSFSANSFPADLNFFENMHLNVDVNKVKADIEKQNQLIASIKWNNMKDQLKDDLMKDKLSKQKEIVKGRKMIFPPVEFKLNTPEGDQWMFKYFNTLRNRVSRPRQADTLNLPNNEEPGDFFYISPGKDNVPEFPPQPQRRKKSITVSAPVLPPPAARYEYSFRSRQDHSPKIACTVAPPEIHIEYREGAVIINGEKIDLSDIKRVEAEKLIRRLVEKDNKQLIAVESPN